MLEGVGRKLATILQTKLGVASFDIVLCTTAVYYWLKLSCDWMGGLLYQSAESGAAILMTFHLKSFHFLIYVFCY